MIKHLMTILAVFPTAANAQTLQAGDWEVTSKIVDLTVPGLPGFIIRMIRGKSKDEHKHLLANQGIQALLAPDPKAQCKIDSQQVAEGHYTQILSCPQKYGEPMHISRMGTYDATGFLGKAEVTGTTAKGTVNIVLDQRAAQVRVGER